MQDVGRSRRRTGARRWNLYTDREHPAIMVEAFEVGSWAEHLSQHQTRATGYDSHLLHTARRYADQDPVVSHLLFVDAKRKVKMADDPSPSAITSDVR